MIVIADSFFVKIFEEQVDKNTFFSKNSRRDVLALKMDDGEQQKSMKNKRTNKTMQILINMKHRFWRISQRIISCERQSL